MNNKKGFISTSTIYCLLIVFLLMLLVLLLLYNNSRMLLSEYKSALKTDLIENNTYTDENSLYNKILLSEGSYNTVIASKQAISQKVVTNFYSVSTEDEGLYAVADEYGTSYYYRGAVDDNWVYFAGFYWRIIRIDGSGNIKIIYSGDTAPTSEESVVMISEGTQIDETSTFNSLASKTYYSGYVYSSTQIHGDTYNSVVKDAVDTWYNTYIYFEQYNNYLESTIYCIDREAYYDVAGSSSVTSVSTASHYYSSAINLLNMKSIDLMCSNQSDKLESYVGLISAYEISLAGGVYPIENTSYYLYTGQSYWTLSPNSFSSAAYVFNVNSSGTLTANKVNEQLGIRPVVALSADTIVLSGSGLYNDPYIITEDDEL